MMTVSPTAPAMSEHTPGPWFVSGVRFRMNGGEWHSVNRYDEAKKQDENIACVGYDPRTGIGLADARLIAAAPAMLEYIRSSASAGCATADDLLRKHALSPQDGRGSGAA